MICRLAFVSLRLRVSNQSGLYFLPVHTFSLAFASCHLFCSSVVSR
jgi:hypothetical protein